MTLEKSPEIGFERCGNDDRRGLESAVEGFQIIKPREHAGAIGAKLREAFAESTACADSERAGCWFDDDDLRSLHNSHSELNILSLVATRWQ
jgi:hypothetical protein